MSAAAAPTLHEVLATKATGKTTLRHVGLCGADDSVDPKVLACISARAPFAEWGVLLRPDKAGEPRYASDACVEALARAAASTGGVMRLAGHLCGSRVDQVLKGDASFVERLAALGFSRVQVNATAVNGVNMDLLASGGPHNVLAVIRAVPQVEFILQKNAETKPLWEAVLAVEPRPANVSVLHDESKGTGKPFEGAVPAAVPRVPNGWAGGIGPATIAAALAGVAAAAPPGSGDSWVDMESSLRTQKPAGSAQGDFSAADDVFDIGKCWVCLAAAADSGLCDFVDAAGDAVALNLLRPENAKSFFEAAAAAGK